MKTIKLLVLAMSLWVGMAVAQKGEVVAIPAKSQNPILLKDQYAEFLGDVEFRQEVAKRIDAEKINEYEHLSVDILKVIKEAEKNKKPVPVINLRAEVTFIVEPDGTLSTIKSEGANQSFNREIERAIKSIETKWRPEIRNGEVIRSRYRFPINMKFD